MQERPGQIGDYWLSKRRGSEQWCRTWFDTDTRQTRRASLGTDDFQAAKLALWEWFSKHGRVAKQDAASAPLELVLVRYWQQYAHALPSAEMARIALAYWSQFWAGATVGEVLPPRQRQFMAWLKSQRTPPLSDGYIKRVMGVGKAALNWAWKEGELSSAPYVVLGRDSPAKELVFTVAQSQAIWDAATQPHERMYLALAYGTLARPEAILELTRESVDFRRRLLVQNPPGRPQTKKYRPTVPLCDFLMPWLLEAPAGPLVQWRGKPIDSFKTAWRRIRASAGLPKEAVPKTIRHTMATHLRESGVPEPEIQGFLGHKAYSGKTEVYAKYRPEYLREAAAAVDRYMAGLRVNCVLEAKTPRHKDEA